MTDLELGRDALKYFHNGSVRYPAYGGKSFEDLLSLYGKKADIYMDGIGLAIRANGMSSVAVQTAMNNLARQAQGRIPKDHQSYMAALQGEAGKINYLDLTTTVAKEVATNVAQGAQALGDNVIGTLKILNYVWPIALGFFLWTWYKSQLKRVKK